MEASSDAFLLLIVGIALQNELDNTRALLSQKGEFPRGPGKPLTWVVEGEALGGRPPTFWQSQGLSLLHMSKSPISSCDWQKRKGKGGDRSCPPRSGEPLLFV